MHLVLLLPRPAPGSFFGTASSPLPPGETKESGGLADCGWGLLGCCAVPCRHWSGCGPSLPVTPMGTEQG